MTTSTMGKYMLAYVAIFCGNVFVERQDVKLDCVEIDDCKNKKEFLGNTNTKRR